ncbi:ABC transporter substrate-binding protein [Colwellia sp. 12G3]|uniref:ABC transporter substrate-binding protein n=1 Tax=Colwellia sp. 12G3 TaxID=2058299 RepID=UPI000C3231DE|nr:ABC transporter substrate-binding protein [Colwellia sp. 12G3]PKI13125.1 toluene tolerance protein [Colwellia sp. 12G3]
MNISKFGRGNIFISLVVSLIISHNAIANSEEATTLASQVTELPINATRSAVDQSNPYLMIKGAAEQTFQRFAREQQAIQDNPNLLKDIVREELMPYINYKYSAFKVIGTYLKKTTDEERRAFVPVFREYLVSSYAQVFTLYDNQVVNFSPERTFEDKKIVAVNTSIIMPGRDNIDVAFKVRLNTKTKQWQAFDMVAEGISLLDSKQAELGSIIRQKGLPYVTELLKTKSTRDIVFKNRAVKNENTTEKKEQQG